MSNVYEQLKSALLDFEQRGKEKVDFGLLGYTVNGVYSVPAEDPTLFRVRLDDGTFLEIPHFGKVPPYPDFPVEVHYNDKGQPFIFGPNNNNLIEFLSRYGATTTVGWHSHHLGSGMEFPIDLRLILQMSPRIIGGYALELIGGWYYVNNELFYLENQIVNLQPYAPSQTSYKRWVVVGLDLTNDPHSVIIQQGSVAPAIQTLSIPSIKTIPTTTVDYLPLFAVMIYQNKIQIEERDIVSLLNVVNYSSAQVEETHVTVCGMPVFCDGDFVIVG